MWAGLARRGFVVLVFDPICQGERSEYWDAKLGQSAVGIATKEHTMAGLQSLLVGWQAARYLVWDGIRAVDYLVSRPDVDPERIGVAGNSGGGNQSAYLALFEPRLAAAAPSCWMTSTEKLFTELGPQDAEQNVVPMVAEGLGIEDFPLAMAPRPFLYATATRDFFPIAGARAAYQETRRIYGLLGQAEAAGWVEADDTHSWSAPRRRATMRWFSRWLNHQPDDDGAEPETPIETVADLNCTPTGQLRTSLGGETIHSLALARAVELARARPRRTREGLARVVRRRLNVAPAAMPAVGREAGPQRAAYREEKLVLATEPGIRVPALLYLPEGGGRSEAEIVVDPGGAQAVRARPGVVVLALEPRGMGAGAPADTDSPPHSLHYRTVMRALQMGKPVLGMQVYDVLSAFEYLKGRPEVDAGRIRLRGLANGATVALLAALLEPRVAGVSAEGGIESYMEIVRQPTYRGVLDLIVPGVLEDFDLPEVRRAIEQTFGGRTESK
jgi:cephalosporin-C deacetylase-like acetyl esterase